jgi:hypothetical protein
MRLSPRAAPWRATIVSVISVLLCASPVVAQQPVGAVLGTIRDSAGKAVVNVEVRVPARNAMTRSDTAGAFRVGGLAPGKVELSFRRLGYEPSKQEVIVSPGAAQAMSVTLTELPQELAALVVEADVRAREALVDFWNRKEAGFGHFITRAEIEKRNPSYLSDMMRMVPGTQLVPSKVGGSAVLRFARATQAPGRDCPPQYFVDGIMVRGFNIDDMPPIDVEGIEIYAGVSVIPAQFRNNNSTMSCGVVAIWSRVPGT